MLRKFVAAGLALLLPIAGAHAAGAVVESLKGNASDSASPLRQGHRIAAPTAISTQAGAQVFLRFDDGMQVVLGEQSLLRVVDFRHTGTGATDRVVFELLRGSARVVTGKVAAANPKQFFFRTPQTELMVDRHADFSVALVNPAYITVHAGLVTSSNGWGTMALSAGSTTAVASGSAAPAAIAASSLPPSASAAMSNLAMASASTSGGAATGVASTAAGVGGAGIATPLIILGITAAGVAAAAANNDDTPAPATTTSHH